jgi:rRNA processing protein Gar1
MEKNEMIQLEVGDKIYYHYTKTTDTITSISDYIVTFNEGTIGNVSIVIGNIQKYPQWITLYPKKVQDKIELWKKMK